MYNTFITEVTEKMEEYRENTEEINVDPVLSVCLKNAVFAVRIVCSFYDGRIGISFWSAGLIDVPNIIMYVYYIL